MQPHWEFCWRNTNGKWWPRKTFVEADGTVVGQYGKHVPGVVLMPRDIGLTLDELAARYPALRDAK